MDKQHDKNDRTRPTSKSREEKLVQPVPQEPAAEEKRQKTDVDRTPETGPGGE